MADTEDVNQDEVEESSTSTEPDVNEATDSSTDASAVAKGSQATESENADTEAVPTREALIAQLTGKGKKQETKAEAEKPEADVEDEEETEEPKADEPLKATEETDISDEEINAPLGKDGTRGARERIQHLLKQRNERDHQITEQKPLAEFGKHLLDVASEAKMNPEQLGAWIALGADTHRDPRNLPLRLVAEAKRIAASLGVQIPKDVETLVPKELDDIEEMLITDLADGNIPADVMKRYRDKIRTARAGKSTAPAPVPPPAQQVVQSSPPAQTPRSDPQNDPATRQGIDSLNAVRAEYAKKLPTNWAQVEAAVTKRMGIYKGADPQNWGTILRKEIESYIRENSTPVKKAPSTQPLRPTSSTTTASTRPKDGKSAAIGILTGKIK